MTTPSTPPVSAVVPPRITTPRPSFNQPVMAGVPTRASFDGMNNESFELGDCLTDL
jgi:hypothetical protein